MYDSIAGSRYLIQLKGVQSTRKNTTMQLEPVGDPHARPVVLRDLENAIHEMLHSLVDLHKAGYTHRDLRWENCIKVNVEDEWKWVIIELEAAGRDGEEWEGDGLTAWDESMLEDCN
jgi:tRNA A-37 threonylcarbamoyl transferase component Bud32